MLTRYLDPKNALAFKRIFGSEQNKDILIHFLNDILERHHLIEGVTFLKTVQDREVAPHRVSLVDVLCQDQKGNKFVIEMQLPQHERFDKRALYYASKAYSEHRKENVYFLAITNFLSFPHERTWFSKIKLDNLEAQVFFLQLSLFKKGKDDLKSMSVKEKWAYFFKYANEINDRELEELIGKDLIIHRAFQELDRFNWSEAELNTYDSIEMKQFADAGVRAAAFDMGFAKGFAESYAEGIEEGEKKKSLEIAKKLLANCLAVSQVSQITGLSEEDIEALAKD